jgi:hypothetical protein
MIFFCFNHVGKEAGVSNSYTHGDYVMSCFYIRQTSGRHASMLSHYEPQYISISCSLLLEGAAGRQKTALILYPKNSLNLLAAPAPTSLTAVPAK